MAPADAAVDAARAKTFVRTDPATGLRTYITWAKDLAPGASPGTPFTATVPVRTAKAEVVAADWVPAATVDAVSGGISVTLTPDDPSPVVIVREIGPLPTT